MPSGPAQSLAGTLLRVLLAFVLASAAVTALAGVLELCGVDDPSRIARKPLLPIFVGAWLLVFAKGWRDLPGQLGWRPATGARRAVLIGLACGAGSLLLLNLILLASGARVLEPRSGYALKILLYLLQALALGLMEESLFRGLLHHRLRIATGSASRAVVIGSLLFAAAHFLRPPKDRPPGAWWDTMLACWAGLAEIPAARWKEALGLFLVGLVLAVLRVRTGNIMLALGVHAGWVWARLSARRLLEEVDTVVDDHLLLLGTMRIYDGLAGWAALVLTLLVALGLQRRSSRDPSGRPIE